MNCRDRRRAEAQQRAHEARLRKDAEQRAAHETKRARTPPLPHDIKRDIAKTVRSLKWHLPDEVRPHGLGFYRALTGYLTLGALDIPSSLSLRGMIYRAGPDEYRDVVAFCEPGNVGISSSPSRRRSAG